MLVGSEIDVKFAGGYLRKNKLTRCQISSSETFLVQIHKR